MPYLISSFGARGSNVILGTGSIICGGKNIYVGNDVYIGPQALIYTTLAKVYIGNKVVIGPKVSIISGDHRTDVIGSYMADVREKLPENDRDIIIEDDVWIGANVCIFKGVKIGKGSIIAGGAVVIKDIPNYSVYISPQKTHPRFTPEQTILHESIIASNSNKQ